MEYWFNTGITVLVILLVTYQIFTFSSKSFGVSLVKVCMIAAIALLNTITGERLPAIIWSGTGLLFLLLMYMRMKNGEIR